MNLECSLANFIDCCFNILFDHNLLLNQLQHLVRIHPGRAVIVHLVSENGDPEAQLAVGGRGGARKESQRETDLLAQV